jgi:hypothetical protein
MNNCTNNLEIGKHWYVYTPQTALCTAHKGRVSALGDRCPQPGFLVQAVAEVFPGPERQLLGVPRLEEHPARWLDESPSPASEHFGATSTQSRQFCFWSVQFAGVVKLMQF